VSCYHCDEPCGCEIRDITNELERLRLRLDGIACVDASLESINTEIIGLQSKTRSLLTAISRAEGTLLFVAQDLGNKLPAAIKYDSEEYREEVQKEVDKRLAQLKSDYIEKEKRDIKEERKSRWWTRR
jgi:hypothetical protein